MRVMMLLLARVCLEKLGMTDGIWVSAGWWNVHDEALLWGFFLGGGFFFLPGHC